MSVKEKPLTARQRFGSKISETMATIVADPGRAAADGRLRTGGAGEGAAAQGLGDLGQGVDGEMGSGGQARWRVRGADGDRVHARPAGGGHAGRRVLEDDAAGGLGAQLARGQQVDL